MSKRPHFYLIIFCLILTFLLESCRYETSLSQLHEQANGESKSFADFFESNQHTEDGDWIVKYLREVQKHEWQGIDREKLLEVVVNAPESKEISLLAAEYFIFEKDIENAWLWVRRAESQGANSAQFFKTVSLVHSLTGRYDLAIDYINRAILVNRNDPSMYENKGSIYLQYGDTISGIEYLRRAYSQDSSNHHLSLRVAELNMRMGNIPEAEKWLESIGESERNMNHQILLAQIYYQSERELEALALFKSSLQMGQIEAGEYLIKYFRASSNVDSVLFYSNQVLDLDSMNLMALNAKAASFDEKGYFNSAVQYYETVLGYDSLHQEARQGLDKVNGKIAYLRQLKERREAIPVFDLAVPKKKSNLTNE